MDVGKLFLSLAAAVLVFEIVEHVIFPLVWSLKARRRPFLTGVESLYGKRAHVVCWTETSGVVMVDGERWHAESSRSFSPGDVVRITGSPSLILTVTSVTDEPEKLSQL